MRDYPPLGKAGFVPVISVALCFLFTPNWTFAQRSIFDEKVIGKWKAYEVFSRSLQGVARGSGTLLNGKSRIFLDHYKQNRECACFSKGMSEPSFENWFISNPRYSASIKRNKENPVDVILLKYIEDRKYPIFGGRQLPVANRLFLDISPHFCCCGVPLTEFVSKPEFSLKTVGKEPRDGRDLIRVDYDRFYVDQRTSGKTTVHGSAYFDPSRCWCVYQNKITFQKIAPQGGEWEFTYEDRYETIDHPGGFPLLKRWTRTKRKTLGQQNPKQENVISTTDYEWEINDHVPNEEFTLSAFGLPEPGSDTVVKKSMPTYVWIFLCAAVCALLAIGLRYAARRRHASQAS